MCGGSKLPPNTPILVLQNRVDLANQNYEEIKKWGIPNVGTCWGGAVDPNIITVANIHSIKKIDKLLPKFKALFVDEVHDFQIQCDNLLRTLNHLSHHCHIKIQYLNFP